MIRSEKSIENELNVNDREGRKIKFDTYLQWIIHIGI